MQMPFNFNIAFFLQIFGSVILNFIILVLFRIPSQAAPVIAADRVLRITDVIIIHHSQALIVQDGPLSSPFRGFLITHTDTR
jgi:hypothetical protein